MSNQTQLSSFNFEQSSIRVIAINNEPWFVAKDICSSLNISNVTDALIKLDDDEKMLLNNTLGLTESISKQVQELNLVSESGMYTLILRCRDVVKKGSVPHRFRKWVTAEVLPQIRKTGSYTKTTTDERTGLRQAVSQLVSKKGLNYSEAYTLVHQRFNVNHIDEIDAEQIHTAVEYVHRLYLDGELIIPSQTPDYTITDDELHTLSIVINQFVPKAEKFAQKVEMVHRTLFSLLELPTHRHNRIGAEAYDLGKEFRYWTKASKEIIGNLKTLQDQRLALEN